MSNKNTNKKPESKSVYQIVTERIIDKMEQGIIPWHKPWISACKSWVTNKPYSFLNQLLLDKPGKYLTPNQISKRGWSIKKGAKGSFVTFYKMIPFKHENEDGEEEMKVIPMLRYYWVFHEDDVDGLNSKSGNENPILESPQNIVDTYINREDELTLSCADKKAAYRPSSDSICMPDIKYFDSSDHYYATLFHEMIHSTLKATRCNRPDGENNKFGSGEYGREELIAEIGSAMLCQMCGIASDILIDNSTAYLQNWMNAIQGDIKLITQAAGKAEKAVNYILYGKGNKKQNIKSEQETELVNEEVVNVA